MKDLSGLTLASTPLIDPQDGVKIIAKANAMFPETVKKMNAAPTENVPKEWHGDLDKVKGLQEEILPYLGAVFKKAQDYFGEDKQKSAEMAATIAILEGVLFLLSYCQAEKSLVSEGMPLGEGGPTLPKDVEFNFVMSACMQMLQKANMMSTSWYVEEFSAMINSMNSTSKH